MRFFCILQLAFTTLTFADHNDAVLPDTCIAAGIGTDNICYISEADLYRVESCHQYISGTRCGHKVPGDNEYGDCDENSQRYSICSTSDAGENACAEIGIFNIGDCSKEVDRLIGENICDSSGHFWSSMCGSHEKPSCGCLYNGASLEYSDSTMENSAYKLTISSEETEASTIETAALTEKCVTNLFGKDFCNEWCNTPGHWGCGIATLYAWDDRNPTNEDYTCDCEDCNGCTETESTEESAFEYVGEGFCNACEDTTCNVGGYAINDSSFEECESACLSLDGCVGFTLANEYYSSPNRCIIHGKTGGSAFYKVEDDWLVYGYPSHSAIVGGSAFSGPVYNTECFKRKATCFCDEPFSVGTNSMTCYGIEGNYHDILYSACAYDKECQKTQAFALEEKQQACGVPFPSTSPSTDPSQMPTSSAPSDKPTSEPSEMPSISPSSNPTTEMPTFGPSSIPSNSPSRSPTTAPSGKPTITPSEMPSEIPTTGVPSHSPTKTPTTEMPTTTPSQNPTTEMPSSKPSVEPTVKPSTSPSTSSPTAMPSASPSVCPSSSKPSTDPSASPTQAPSYAAIDCVMTQWIDGECDAICGTGTRTQTRYVLVHPAHGGEDCPPITHQMTSCDLIPCAVKGENIQLRIELRMAQGELQARYQSVKDAITAALPSDVHYYNIEIEYMIATKLSRRFLLEMVDYVIDYTAVVSDVAQKDLITNIIGEVGFLEILEDSFASYDLNAQISNTYAMVEASVNGKPISSDIVWAVVLSILSIIAFVIWRYGNFCPKEDKKEEPKVLEMVIENGENCTAHTSTGGNVIPASTISVGKPGEIQLQAKLTV